MRTERWSMNEVKPKNVNMLRETRVLSEVQGYVDTVQAQKIVGQHKKLKLFKFVWNNGSGKHVQCLAWEGEVNRVAEIAKMNEISHVDEAKAKGVLNPRFNIGNMPYELNIRRVTDINVVGVIDDDIIEEEEECEPDVVDWEEIAEYEGEKIERLNKLFDAIMSIIDMHDCPVIVGGDFNSRVGLGNQLGDEVFEELSFAANRSNIDKTLNKNCILLHDKFEQLGLVLLNGRSKSDARGRLTFLGSAGISTIDLAWTNLLGLNYIEDFEIRKTGFSDHLPICVTLHSTTKTKNDLILISEDIVDLQHKLDTLEAYCLDSKLELFSDGSNSISRKYVIITTNQRTVSASSGMDILNWRSG